MFGSSSKGLELHEDGDLRLLVAGLRERLHYGGVGPDTIEGLLDGEDFGVVGGGPDELDDRGEGVEGMIEQDIPDAPPR